jgi:hypothetical protein
MKRQQLSADFIETTEPENCGYDLRAFADQDCDMIVSAVSADPAWSAQTAQAMDQGAAKLRQLRAALAEGRLKTDGTRP